MKLTQKTINQADRVIRVNTTNEIPFNGLLKKIATATINTHGFYSFVRGDEKTLIILAQVA